MKFLTRLITVSFILTGIFACKDGTDFEYRYKTFNAVRRSVDNDASKSSLVNHTQVRWTIGDEIAVYGQNNTPVKFTAESSDLSTAFSSATGVNGSSFNMVYPYSAAKGMTDGLLDVYIPQVQKAYIGSFDPAATVSIAKTDNLSEDVIFDNALSLIEFTIPEYLSGKIHTVIFESRNEEALAGDIILNPDNISNTMKHGGESYSSVILKSAPAMAQGNYHIAIRPCILSSGFRVKAIMYDKSYYFRELTYSYECDRNHIYNIGTIGSAMWYYTSFEYVVSTVSGAHDNRATGGVLTDGDSKQTTWRIVDALEWMSDGNIIAADSDYSSLRVFNPKTGYTTTWFTPENSNYLNIPWRMLYRGTDLYVVNKGNDNILKISPNKEATLIDNSFEETNGLMDVDFDSEGNMYVLDRDLRTIYKYKGTDASSRNTFVTLFKPLAMRFTSDDIILVSSEQSTIQAISENGTITAIAGNSTNGHSDGTPGYPLTAELGYIYDFVIAEDGTIYLSQWEGSLSDSSITTGSNIRMIVPDAYGTYQYASVVTLAGNDEPGFAEGSGKDAKMKRPYGIAVSPEQNAIYFSDRYNYSIRKIDVVENTIRIRQQD